MIRQLFFILVLVFIEVVSLAQDKPNIVLLYVDDWAWNGSSVQMDDEIVNSYIPSLLSMPNLDKLAADGMIFSNAYSGAPQCSPSRAALQTGQSSPRNGYTVYMNSNGEYYDENPAYSQFPVVPCISDMYLDDDEYTIAKVLNPLGYTCAHFGKWHLRGNPGDYGYAFHDGETTNNEGNELIPGDPKRMFSTTQNTVEFIETQVNDNKPFYVQVSHYAMHEGRECLPGTRAKYQGLPELQLYYKSIGQTPESIAYKQDPATWLGMAEDLDGTFGTILDKLKELGIEDSTYVIVTSDNGYRQDFYDELLRLPQPLHGHKWWLWQGGLRVAMIAKGPDIQAGSVFDENVVVYDFLPTFLEWAGGSPETDLSNIDGVSLVSIMRGEAADSTFSERNIYFHYPHYRTTMPHSAVISGNKKLIHFYETPDVPILFNLDNDMSEVSNNAGDDQEEHAALFDDLMQYLDNVGARIPLYPNPDYDSLVYAASNEYPMRVLWGAFTGKRELEKDEYISSKAKLYQHLSSINTNTIKTDGSLRLTAWNDQSIKNHNALPGTGEAYFPSERLFESGMAGVDFGSPISNLELLSSESTDSIIDFTGAASGKDGFALAIAFQPATLKDEWCYLVGNSISPDDSNSFGIRYNDSGNVEAFLGGKTLQTASIIEENKTTVLVLNYNSSTGILSLNISSSESLTTELASADFSNSSSIFLAGPGFESSGFFDGMIGEIKLFDMALSDEQVIDEYEQMLESWTRPADKKLLLHLDASAEESVMTNESGLLNNWKDLSGNENHAITVKGELYFPSVSASESGLPGVDFGVGANKLELFSSEETDNFLDFTGLASRNNGMAIFITFKIDDFLDNHHDLIGNNTSISEPQGLFMRYDKIGKPKAYAGGELISVTTPLQKGSTVVFALNYDKLSQKMKFWNSSSGESFTTQLAPGDFSNENSFTVGSLTASGRFMIGMVGELKLFNYSLSDQEFVEQYEMLETKWITGATSSLEISDTHPSDFTIYPNPVTDVLIIKGLDSENYKIYNILGNKLLEGDRLNSIDVSGLDAGLYLISVGGKLLKFVKSISW